MRRKDGTRVLELAPNRVLAVYSHPDDADVACGGTLATWAARGAEVWLVLLCDGGKGTINAAVSPKTLASIRAGEVAVAAKAIGVTNVEMLNIPDGEVDRDGQLAGELVRRIRSIKPEVVLGHDPTAVFFGSVYVNHRDHRAAGWALLDAVAPASAMPHYFPECGPAHRVADVLLSGTLDADAYVDITSGLEAKVAAVMAHESQLVGEPGWVAASVRSRAEADGRTVGVAAAEGFRHLELDR